MAQKPVVQTELARLLYKVQGSTIERLAEQLGIGRQCAGKWVSGREAVPRRRQAQIIFYVEAGEIPLFDEDGVARPVREGIAL